MTDGTTLLGADDKAGIAEIMTAAAQIIEADKACEGNTAEHIAHGKICIASFHSPICKSITIRCKGEWITKEVLPMP